MKTLDYKFWAVALVFLAIFVSFFRGTYEVYRQTGDWGLFFILALIGIGCIIAVILYNEWHKLKRLKALSCFASSHIEHFKTCTIGMPCDDFTFITIAGPNSDELPDRVRERMTAHENVCAYHQSKTWRQSALSTPVTDAMEFAAAETIKKYDH